MRRQQRLQLVLCIAILIGLNFLGAYVYEMWDLTEEKRYTLTQPTVDLLMDVDDVIYVKVLLSGDLPAGFKRLRRATTETLNQFRRRNNLIHYDFENPQEKDVRDANARAQELAKDGIIPTRLRIRDAGESQEKLIYPYALFYYGNRMYPVNLLENERPGVDNEWILNNSISLLEYKFANAIQKIRQSLKANILFTSGHGELAQQQTAALENTLRRNYNTARADLDTVTTIPQDIDLLIVAKPTGAFTDKELFVIDQYVVNGGNVIFLIDQLNVGLDSMSQQTSYVPYAYDLNLAPLLFKYGVRVNPDLVLDLECSRIPLVVGQLGDRVQTDLFRWYYHPLVTPDSDHPVVKNIGRVNLKFPSTIDTLRTKAKLQKTILLRTSRYSRLQRIPVRLNFEILRLDPDPDLFDMGPQNVAVLVEGEQLSLFENRVTDEMRATLKMIGTEFTVQNEPSKILVVADGDVVKNLYNPETGEYSDIGYNKYENYVFQGNAALILNAIEYMLDKHGILEARSKEVKLRMLNIVKAQEESLKWQMLNIVLPLVVMIAGVLGFNLWRRRKYRK